MRIGAAVVISRPDDDDVSFTATIDGMDKVSSPQGGATFDRLTVTRHDSGIKEYVVVGEGVLIEEIAPQVGGVEQPASIPEMEGLDHLAPPPGAPPAPMPPRVAEMDPFPTETPTPTQAPSSGMAPMPGSNIGGMTLPTVASTVPLDVHQGSLGMAADQPADETPDHRFMAKPKSGTSTVYHTVHDCPRARGLKWLPVGDAEIEFHDLTLCTSCSKLAEQISWRDVIEQVLGHQVSSLKDPRRPSYVVTLIAAAFEEYGFSVKPDRVDRPESA